MMKKIIVIDDSALMRRHVSDIINSTSEYHVDFFASDGLEALEILREHHDIDVAICDLNMPRMDGLQLLEKIAQEKIPVPVVMFSSNSETKNTIMALELGAIDFVKKPDRIGAGANFSFRSKLLSAMNIAAAYKQRMLVGNILQQPAKAVATKVVEPEKPVVKKETVTESVSRRRARGNAVAGDKIVALACSTGGPKALQSVIPKLPANLAAPVVIVQHMPAGFTDSLAQRLNSLSEIQVKEAKDGEILQNGYVYIAKGGTHLMIDGGTIKFNDDPPVVGLKPCANIMYESLCSQSYNEIICVVLTGMGSDGTNGIKQLKQAAKNMYVISQDEASSTVYGMPKAVFEQGLTNSVHDLNDIAAAIVKKVGVL